MTTTAAAVDAVPARAVAAAPRAIRVDTVVRNRRRRRNPAGTRQKATERRRRRSPSATVRPATVPRDRHAAVEDAVHHARRRVESEENCGGREEEGDGTQENLWVF